MADLSQTQVSYPCFVLQDLSNCAEAAFPNNPHLTQLQHDLEHLDRVLFFVDLITQRLLYLTPSCKTILATAQRDFLENPDLWKQFIFPEDLPGLVKKVGNLINLGEVQEFENQIKCPDGETRWLHVKLVPCIGDTGKIVGMDGILADITDHKRTQAAREMNESELQAICAALHEIVIVFDREGKCLRTIIGDHILLGQRTAAGIVGKAIADIFSSPSSGLLQTQIQRAFETNQTVYGDFLMELDGREVWFAAEISVVPDNRVVLVVREITKGQTNDSIHRHQAFPDPLTRLPNRAQFTEHLNHVIQWSPNQKGPSPAVLLLELDHFKIINDSLGSHQGERYLQYVSQRIKKCIRSTDTLARFDGKTFAILLVEVHSETMVIQIAKRIQQVLLEPIELASHEVFTSTSIGMAFLGYGYRRAEEIIRDADTALYQAKTMGKGRYIIFHAQMRMQNLADLQVEADLRRAIDREEFELFYQPVFATNDKKLSGAEALIRWQHPHRGRLLPGDFIEIAEETGLILPMGEWGLKTACRQAKAWYETGFRNLKISVNLSACQLYDPDFAQTLIQILTDTDLPSHLLELEITESVAMRDTDRSIKIIRDLAAYGVNIALDNFGKGYSSLSYLKLFPLNRLKIDRSFVQQVTCNQVDATIVSAVISLAHALGIEVVAEGVETEAQLAFLTQLHCDLIQGFLFSPAINGRSFDKLLQTNQNSAVVT